LLSHPLYEEVKEAGLFVKEAEEEGPHVCQFWGGKASYLDFTNPNTVSWFSPPLSSSPLFSIPGRVN